MKVSKKIFIIFSMILLLVSPVTSLGKDIKWYWRDLLFLCW